ncbi:hybrid sensor histidine kinase/response regulator [Nostoc sp. CENA67]|uniref:histidine kinase n=1 Tax=Amazonocrinis nigriterrae CENA67 TaxID=2794033 RepID=A0A8J7HLB6_9NOST|nr:ATP-binding protein [Amazonocrinis nigriterrae]MBH8560775.1 hybrid sensor histidine kinase/response regulator [Amazonocrinis nigriterrae CENA67]
MSMLQYPLYDFLATVPSCVETSTLTVVLEIFEKEQCDRLVVVNQQQCPVGLLYSARLTQKLLTAASSESLTLQQPLSSWGQNLIDPIQTLFAADRVEQFSLFLRHQQSHTNKNLDWALIDIDGKFLGLVDSQRLLGLLVKEKAAIEAVESLYSSAQKTSHNFSPESVDTGNKGHAGVKTHWRSHKGKIQEPSPHKPLVQLLERLPWPLMLQTGTGEVVTQNPAWWQQLGALKDPEGVRRQVEAILAPVRAKQPEYASQKVVQYNHTTVCHREYEHGKEAQSMPMKLHPDEYHFFPKNEASLPEQPATAETTSSRCFLDSQMGTCTCIVEVQNGQERVWQFVKIPLDSPELKVKSPDPPTRLNPGHLSLGSDDLWLVLATDVTEQQQLCKELAAKNADLIQLNRLKDEFLACISHELKTPLTAVLGLSRLLVDQQLGKLNERQARYAGLIHQSGRHLMSVVNDILDLTRMETGQMELTLVPVKIRAVCDRALLEAKTVHTQSSKTTSTNEAEAGRSSSPEFTLSIEPGLDQIVADELRLRQMLIHLLSNAFKFTETSGEIGLRVSRWEGWVAFTVWDTGIGIPEHQQHLIFQKFQQLENPLTRQFEGTGLGLVLTRALARLHGGDVSFLSREGKGSQFTLLLPPSPPTTGFTESEMASRTEGDSQNVNIQRVTTSAHQRVNANTQHHPTCSQRLVLVVEAVARYIEDLTDQLKGLGYRVVIARSGTEAVEKARRLQPKAIFLNPLLPLLSGWDVLTLLKSDAATRHISVIVTATAAEKEQTFAKQADGFLSLPVELQSLAPLLEKLCATPAIPQPGVDSSDIISTKNPLRILRLVNPVLESINPHPSLREHRVIEVDDLDQAELLARVWQFDVILLDVENSLAQTYLQQFTQHPRLAALPLVTCDVATTLTASQIPGLSVFPCLTPLATDHSIQPGKPDPLLSVLQIASGICYPPSILVVDLTMLHDLPQTKHKQAKGYRTAKNPSLSSETAERGSEWFQALIQYLQTAGLKAAMGNVWAEVLQQIRHQSVDLLLICLGESSIHKEVIKALKALEDLPFNLPPIVVLDQRLNSIQINSPCGTLQPEKKKTGLESIENVLSAIATQILPRSISMEDLLSHINQALAVKCRSEKS